MLTLKEKILKFLKLDRVYAVTWYNTVNNSDEVIRVYRDLNKANKFITYLELIDDIDVRSGIIEYRIVEYGIFEN